MACYDEKKRAQARPRDSSKSVARRILDRLEIHYTPKHGSWLNMAEIELSVLSGQ
ncbi:MAG: transposase [Magnetococcales bacterium]|nr:transposase [Magnetococcales bacterium]